MKVARTLSTCTFFLLLVEHAGALDPSRDIHQLAHRSWREEDGYPGRGVALAQTTDGFLWIGGDRGLFRFDGVHFVRYAPSSGDALSQGPVRGLLALPDGSLWITYRLENKICVLRNGSVKGYGEADGVTSNPTALVQDHDGTLWANTQTGLIRFNGTRWEHIGKDWNFPEDVPHLNSIVLFVDSHGTLWAGVNHTILYLKRGSKRFEYTGAFAGWSVSIAEAPDGTMWLADNFSYVRALSTPVSAQSAAIARCEVETPKGVAPNCPNEVQQVVRIRAVDRLLFDHNGSLWITTDTSGVFRVSHSDFLRGGPLSETSDAVQRITSKDGLSADHSIAILEDREGNIWITTQNGLDQFRDARMVSVALPDSSFQTAIAPAEHGDIWVAGSWAYIARIHGDPRNVPAVPADAFKPYRDPAGVTWLIGNSLAQWRDGKFRTVAQAPDGNLGSFGTWQIAGDRFGRLWAFSNGYGFFFLDQYRWRPWTTPPEVAKQHVTNMFTDSTGLIWVATYEGHIITMNNGTLVDYPSSPLRYVKAFAERARQEIWAGGEGGLVLIDRGHFRPIKPAALDSLEDVTGIVDAASEGLWLNTSSGVIHISRDDVDRALRDPAHRVQCERFDSSDGLPGLTETIYPYPKAIQGMDGRIWFTASKGVAWVDPKNIPRNVVPPPVSITSVSADGSHYPPVAGLRLAVHTSSVQIDYSALSLSVPERVRFRYKLDGADKAWQDVGTRREAYYSNLGPGPYRFHVVACNNDGVWNEAGASFDFAIAPAYYQTRWFQVSCVAVLLVLLFGLYKYRLYQIAHEFNVRLEERVGERARLARDLHDTLLQSFHGLMLRFQVVNKLLPEGKAKEQLEKALERADQAIAEGRSAVYDLRSSTTTANDLSEALNSVGSELSSEGSAEFGLLVEGPVRDLHPIIRDEVYRISREALRNAFQHARARHIEAEINYGDRLFRLRVRDDGEGIPAEIVEQGRPGHYGLPGMRERARQAGADLTIWSRLGSGTEIELSMSSSIAYVTSPRRSLLSVFGKKVGMT